DRNGSTAGGVPALAPIWKVNTISDPASRDWVQEASAALESARKPVLASSHPLGIVLKRETGEPKPLVVYRDWGGLRARTLGKLEKQGLKPGEVFWEHASDWSLERMMKEPKHVKLLMRWLGDYVSRRPGLGVLLDNSLTGTLASDGIRVYAI